MSEQQPEDQVAQHQPPTGDPRVAAAVERLDTLGERPPAEHVEVYEDVHRVLQDALADAARDDDAGDGGRRGDDRP